MLPRLASVRQDDAGRTPTIELLEGCLRDVQQVHNVQQDVPKTSCLQA